MDISMKKTTTITPFLKRRQTREQAKFLQKLGELLAEGFAMKDSLQFLQIITPKQANWIEEVQKGMENGGRLDEELKEAGFPEQITSQLFLAHIHGGFAETLISCGKQLAEQLKKRQELAALLQYPMLLVLFLIGMLLSMRFILMPHMESMMGSSENGTDGISNAAVSFVYHSPYWLLFFSLMILVLVAFFHFFMKRKSALQKATFFSKLPLVGRFVRLYYTYQFGQEWSLLFKSGLTMQEIVGLMQEKGASRLMKETGNQMERTLRQGYSFKTALEQFQFILTEMGFIILHGESTGNLGAELAIYAKDCLNELNRQTQKYFQYIQPILFLVIALMVVSIYAALLLPMFSMVKEIG